MTQAEHADRPEKDLSYYRIYSCKLFLPDLKQHKNKYNIKKNRPGRAGRFINIETD